VARRIVAQSDWLPMITATGLLLGAKGLSTRGSVDADGGTA